MNNSIKSRGRPARQIVWPENKQITVHDLLRVNDVSRVTAQKWLKMAVTAGQYRPVDSGKKWEATVYEKNNG